MVLASTRRSVFGFHCVNVPSLLASGLSGVHLDLKRQAENVKRIPPELVSLEECFTGTQRQSENRNQSGNVTSSAACSESCRCIDLACVSLAPFEWKNNRKWLKLGQPLSHFRMWAQGCLVHSLLPCPWKCPGLVWHADSPHRKGAATVSFCYLLMSLCLFLFFPVSR